MEVSGGQWRCMEECGLWIFDCGWWMGKGRRDEKDEGILEMVQFVSTLVC